MRSAADRPGGPRERGPERRGGIVDAGDHELVHAGPYERHRVGGESGAGDGVPDDGEGGVTGTDRPNRLLGGNAFRVARVDDQQRVRARRERLPEGTHTGYYQHPGPCLRRCAGHARAERLCYSRRRIAVAEHGEHRRAPVALGHPALPAIRRPGRRRVWSLSMPCGRAGGQRVHLFCYPHR
jgi:hypothetical protein